MHFGGEPALLLRLTAFSTGGRARSLICPLVARGFYEGSHQLDGLPQLRNSDVLCFPPRASSLVLSDAGPMRAWHLLAGETETTRSEVLLWILTLHESTDPVQVLSEKKVTPSAPWNVSSAQVFLLLACVPSSSVPGTHSRDCRNPPVTSLVATPACGVLHCASWLHPQARLQPLFPFVQSVAFCGTSSGSWDAGLGETFSPVQTQTWRRLRVDCKAF